MRPVRGDGAGGSGSSGGAGGAGGSRSSGGAGGAGGSATSGGAGESAAEGVASALREEILRGDLAPGTPLREVSLAERFDVSRTTIREAIRLLAPAGLAHHRRHHGAVVAAVTPEDLADVQRARAVIERSAAEAVAGVASARLWALDEVVDAMADAMAAGDTAAVVEADLAFHRALVALLDSPRIDAWYAALQNELRLGLAVTDRRVVDPGKVAAHRRIAALARRRNVVALRAAVGEHLTASAADVQRAVGGAS